MPNRMASAILALVLVSGLTAMAARPAAAADGRAAIVVDARTGAVLYERNAARSHYPASLTKMMTLYLLFEAMESRRLSTGDRLPVSAAAAGQSAINLGLKRGETITVEEAINAIVARSANDVAVVVAEALGGDEAAFARKMTQRARQLGMDDTTFRNASGLPDNGQVSSAHDIALLALALQRDFPQYYHYFATRQFRFKGQTYVGHNRVLDRYPGADGLKTGYIRASGFNLASSAERGGRRVVGVVLGSPSSGERDQEMIGLLDRGFEALRDPRPAYARAPVRPEVVQATARTAAARTASVSAPAPMQRPLPALSAQALAAAPEPAVQESEAEADSDWGVQIGAYARKQAARGILERASSAIEAVAEDPRPQIAPFGSGQRRVYRARLVGLSEAQATNACARLSAHNLPCMVVRPQGG